MMQVQIDGAGMLDLPVSHKRRLSLRVCGENVAVFWGFGPDDCQIIHVGSGIYKVRAVGAGDKLIVATGNGRGVVWLDVPELRDAEVGWLGTPSLADLSPKPFGQISPEIQAVIDQMNRNAIAREQAMLRSLGRRGQAV